MRTGFLPRSKQWNAIVEQLSLFGGDPTAVHQIAEATLTAIQNNYKKLPNDESVLRAVTFFATLSYSANQPTIILIFLPVRQQKNWQSECFPNKKI